MANAHALEVQNEASRHLRVMKAKARFPVLGDLDTRRRRTCLTWVGP